MGSFRTFVLCSFILVLLPCSVTSSFNLAPVFSPIFKDLCKHVECGKGSCKPSNSSFGYVCECEPGWKQSRPQHDDDLKFLPCVIPNCSLNFSCLEAPSPAPAKEKKTNDSIFDPCTWADCGGGKCNKTSVFTHECECKEGYYNLLNVTAFPCFKECALGMNCRSLGIGVMNKSSPPSSLPENSSNQGALGMGYPSLGIDVVNKSSPPSSFPSNSKNQDSSTSINGLIWKIVIPLLLASVFLK